MKILVDSDWILELLVNRHQYGKEAEKLLKILNEQSQAQVYATELCLDKINSFLGKEDPQLGQDAVSWVKDLLNDRILSFNNSIRDLASNLFIKDYESAVRVAIAKQENVGAIITLNSEIFTGANLPILSPDQFAKRICLEQKLDTTTTTLVEVTSKTIESLNKLLEVETPTYGNLKSINQQDTSTYSIYLERKDKGKIINIIVGKKVCVEDLESLRFAKNMFSKKCVINLPNQSFEINLIDDDEIEMKRDFDLFSNIIQIITTLKKYTSQDKLIG